MPPHDDDGVSIEAAFVAFCAEARLHRRDHGRVRSCSTRRALDLGLLEEILREERWRRGVPETAYVLPLTSTGAAGPCRRPSSSRTSCFAGAAGAGGQRDGSRSSNGVRAHAGPLVRGLRSRGRSTRAVSTRMIARQYNADIDRYAAYRRHDVALRAGHQGAAAVAEGHRPHGPRRARGGGLHRAAAGLRGAVVVLFEPLAAPRTPAPRSVSCPAVSDRSSRRRSGWSTPPAEAFGVSRPSGAPPTSRTRETWVRHRSSRRHTARNADEGRGRPPALVGAAVRRSVTVLDRGAEVLVELRDHVERDLLGAGGGAGADVGAAAEALVVVLGDHVDHAARRARAGPGGAGRGG